MHVSRSFVAALKMGYINCKLEQKNIEIFSTANKLKCWRLGTVYASIIYHTFDSILKSFPVPAKRRRADRKKQQNQPFIVNLLVFPHPPGKLIHFCLQLCSGQNVCIIKSIESPTNYINKLYFISLTILLLFVIHLIRLVVLFWTSKVHKEEQKPKFCVLCIKSMRAYHNVHAEWSVWNGGSRTPTIRAPIFSLLSLHFFPERIQLLKVWQSKSLNSFQKCSTCWI